MAERSVAIRAAYAFRDWPPAPPTAFKVNVANLAVVTILARGGAIAYGAPLRLAACPHCHQPLHPFAACDELALRAAWGDR